MRKCILRFFSVIVLITVSGCVGDLRASFDQRSQDQIFSDEVARNVTALEGPVQTMQMYAKRQPENTGIGVLAFYTFTVAAQASEAPEEGVGYMVLETRGPLQLDATHHQSMRTSAPPPFIMYDTDRRDGGVLVYGRVIAPEVTRLRVTFDTGRVGEAVPIDGGFVLFEGYANTLHELHVLGSNNLIFATYTQPRLMSRDEQ